MRLLSITAIHIDWKYPIDMAFDGVILWFAMRETVIFTDSLPGKELKN